MRVYNFVLVIFCTLRLSGFVFTKKLPAILRDLRCPLNKDFDSCFLENANKAIPRIADGLPDYGIPKLKPLKIPFVRFLSTPTLSVNMTNVEVYGLEKMRATGHKVDVERGMFSAFLKGENVTIIGDYAADGNVLIMPLKGKGRFSMNFMNGSYSTVHSVKIVERDNDKYMKLTDSRFNANFGRIIFHLDNLFEGNKQLGDQVNAFLNENWETVADDFGPSVGITIAKIIDKIFNKFSDAVPIKELFL